MMKSKCILILLLTLFSIVIIQAQNISNYDLVWSDEFDVDGAPDSNSWNIEVNGDGGGNNELEYYTDNSNNLRVENGELVIEAIKENYLGKQYTSARITTQSKITFQYGRIEARMKLPYGKGMWPAFWLLGSSITTAGWPNCGEMDIMELIGGGSNDATVHATLHWGPLTNGNHPSYGLAYSLTNAKFSDDFHVFALEWDQKQVSIYCDSIKYYTIDISPAGLKAFQSNFFVILNLAVGGNWPGSPDASTVFPQKMEVDYVRIYKKSTAIKNNEHLLDNILEIFPNPAKDKISIKFSNELKSGTNLNIYNLEGKLVKSVFLSDQLTQDIDVSGLYRGIYLIKVGNNKLFLNKKLVLT